MSTPGNRKAISFSKYYRQRTIIQGCRIVTHYANLAQKFLEDYLYCVGLGHVLIVYRHDLVNLADVFGTDVQTFVLVFPEDGRKMVQEVGEDLSSRVV